MANFLKSPTDNHLFYNKKVLLIYFLTITIFISKIYSQKSVWSVKNPFEITSFIQNKGQFDDDKITKEKILFATNQMGMDVLFTNSGVYYVVRKQKKDDNEKEEKKENIEIETSILHYQFLNCNLNAEITSENKVNDYYTYIDKKSTNTLHPSTIKADAFKKIIYKNIYPNIDVEFVIPEKGGIKYSFILHPGANPNLIKMQYENTKNVFLSKNGDLEIGFKKEKIIDQHPYSFYLNSKSTIKTDFVLKNNMISFQLENYDSKQTIIIDPWTINPSFSGTNSGFDISKDANNDVYVSGGSPPYYVKKFNSTGTLLWTYTFSSSTPYYGSHCLDNSGNCFISYGPWIGSTSSKLNSAGVVLYHNTFVTSWYP